MDNMTHMIEVPEDVRQPEFHIPGWKVAVSRQVWSRFVAVPVGATGPREEDRLWDLLNYLWTGMRQQPSDSSGFQCGVGFFASVANNSRKNAGGRCGRKWPDPNIPLAAMATIGRGGSPRLAVVDPREVNAIFCDIRR
jgi:hypothetical protein